MIYREMAKLNEKVSLLSFGAMRLPTIGGESANIDYPEAVRMMRTAFDQGVNYVDTAYGYHGGNSELAVAQALADGYRSKVLLATKSPTWRIESAADFPRFLDEQLTKLQTDHIDFYLQHGLGSSRLGKFHDFEIFQQAQKAKEAGKIRYYGFSFHDRLSVFEELLDNYPWDFVQIQYNYLDTEYQAGRAGLEKAAAMNIPVIAMEPLRGGRLAADLPPEVLALLQGAKPERHPVEWAFRWLADQPGVTSILSGMSTLAQVEHNLALCSIPSMVVGNLTTAERDLLMEVAQVWRARIRVNCTACNYCIPCPQGVEIPGLFSLYNNAAMFETWQQAQRRYTRLVEEKKDAAQCNGCAACEGLCPHKVPIIAALKELAAALAAKN